MPITTANGTTYSDKDIKDWAAVNDPTGTNDSIWAQRAAELGGLNQAEITQALTVGRGGQGAVQDPAKVSAWVADTSNGYGWDNDGSLIAAARTPKSPTATTGYGGAQLGSPTAWNVDPSQTVEGRIASIMKDRNNPILVQARTAADEEMNRRGLSNSSLAISAGEDSAYRAAVPIATSDAATFAKAAGYNADQSNQFAVRNGDYQQQAGIASLQSDTQLAASRIAADSQRTTSQIAADTQRATAQLNADTARYTTNLDITSRERIAQFQTANQTLLNTNQQAAGAFNQAVAAAANINMSTTMDATSKTQAIANIWHDVQNQLKVLGGVAGLDLSSQLFFGSKDGRPPYPGFDAAGVWVGFGAAAPAAPVTDTPIVTATATLTGNGP